MAARKNIPEKLVDVSVDYPVKGKQQEVRFAHAEVGRLIREALPGKIDFPEGMKLHKVEFYQLDMDDDNTNDFKVTATFVSADLP